MDFGPLFGTGQPLHMRLAQSPLLWGSEGFSKDFKESSESKGAHPSHSQKARTGQSQKCPSPRGTEGSNPSPSSAESVTNLRVARRVAEQSGIATTALSGQAVERLPLLAQDAVRHGHKISAQGGRQFQSPAGVAAVAAPELGAG